MRGKERVGEERIGEVEKDRADEMRRFPNVFLQNFGGTVPFHVLVRHAYKKGSIRLQPLINMSVCYPSD